MKKAFEHTVLFEEIDEKCVGCSKVSTDGKTCLAYIKPKIFWRHGKVCPLASHIKIEEKPKEKVRVGQQKQKKK